MTINTINITKVRFHELVGDWSQEIHLCSYNDNGVFANVISDNCNAAFNQAMDGDVARDNLRLMYPGVEDWQQLFNDLLQYHGGWPTNYDVKHTPIKDLPGEYQGYLDKFGKAHLRDLEFRYNFESPNETITFGLNLLYPEIINRISDKLKEIGDVATSVIYAGVKDLLPVELSGRVDEMITSKKALIWDIKLDDEGWLHIAVYIP